MIDTFFRRHDVRHLTVDGTNYSLSAGTSDVNSGSVDTVNCEEVSFLLTAGTMASSSACDVKVQESANNSDWADLAESATTQITATDDDKMVGVTVKRPLKRYLRVAITRGDSGNTTIQSLHAICRIYRNQPDSQGTGAGQFVADPELLVSPVAGTA